MSQQYGGFPPSPTPGTVLYSTRRQYGEQPPPINIVPSRALGLSHDIVGADSSLSTPLSPMFSSIGSAHSNTSNPSMAARAYNPQQWTYADRAGGSHMTFSSSSRRSARESSGMEAMMPSPPPPYTPPPDNASHHTRSSSSTGAGFAPSPLSTENMLAVPNRRSSPSNGSARHFPPPPTINPSIHRDSQRSRFSISGLAARVKRPESSEPASEIANSNVTVASAAFGINPTAPSSRRAASTGAIITNHPLLGGRISPGSAPWEPGMPLPPPPPGPPPTGNRSQSLNRYAHCASAMHNGQHTNQLGPSLVRRRHENTLETIPPTPSDWAPEPSNQPSYPELRIDTGRRIQEGSSGAILTRRSATKDVGTDSIRARRSRSRAKKEGQDSGEYVPADDLARRPSVSPRSSTPPDPVISPAGSLIRIRRAAPTEASSRSSPVQPYSPEHIRRQAQGRHLTLLTPPYTPSTAAPRYKDNMSLPGSGIGSEHQDGSELIQRPFSHTLQAPVHESNAKQLLKPDEHGHEVSTESIDVPEFMQASLNRYKEFIQKEAAVQSDRERLELFASFVVLESRLRRNKYLEAFNAMAGDIMELTRDLWRPLPSAGDLNSLPPVSRKPSCDSVDVGNSFKNSVSSVAELTPATDTESFADETDVVPERSIPNLWGDKFRPCLSPIPSMAVSTVPDGESSRGRSASRWWEESADGSGGDEGRKMERTRQESKYMSLHPQELVVAAEASSDQNTPTPGASKKAFQYDAEEYPPEKVGWHEAITPPLPSTALSTPRNKAPMSQTARITALDISRLVTLPPSYPRHYPAVNNSHPALSTLRANHRTVADLSRIREIIQDHEVTEASRRQAWGTTALERMQRFRSETQEDINTGKMSYRDAAQAELEFKQSEAEKVISQSQRQSEEFRKIVADPVHQMLMRKLQDCNTYIVDLVGALDSEVLCDQSILAQTEGDERPELVERLTLLKWLFESREQIHKEKSDIGVALIARESGTVLTQYRQTHNDAQVRQIERQYESERQNRQMQYARQVKDRFDQLQENVERHVSRGVEIQLSAFWDIAPGLGGVVQKVPQDLHGFEIVVPPSELEENPAYNDFPLQYMFTVLNHAKKSAYQFIEAQINLLCLLHEVHTASALASARLIEIQRSMEGERTGELQAFMVQIREQSERELTEDLKDKVGEVERQWNEALGSGIEDCIERVRMWLQECGGWDQSLDV